LIETNTLPQSQTVTVLQMECCTVQPNDVDADMVTDAALMLWNKCKVMLNRYQSPIVSFPKCLGRIDNVGKVHSFSR